jgi:hypothetical protein
MFSINPLFDLVYGLQLKHATAESNTQLLPIRLPTQLQFRADYHNKNLLFSLHGT